LVSLQWEEDRSTLCGCDQEVEGTELVVFQTWRVSDRWASNPKDDYRQSWMNVNMSV
jgi:hypothetical protein